MLFAKHVDKRKSVSLEENLSLVNEAPLSQSDYDHETTLYSIKQLLFLLSCTIIIACIFALSVFKSGEVGSHPGDIFSQNNCSFADLFKQPSRNGHQTPTSPSSCTPLSDNVTLNDLKKFGYDCVGDIQDFPLCRVHDVCLYRGSWVQIAKETPCVHIHIQQDPELCDKPTKTLFQPRSACSLPFEELIYHREPTIFIEHYTDNFGHVLGDEIWPIFRAFNLLGLERMLLQQKKILYHGDSLFNGSPERKAQKKMFDLLKADLLNVDSLKEDPTFLHCFESIITGFTQLGYAMSSPQQWECGEEKLSHTKLSSWTGEFPSVMQSFVSHCYQRYSIERRAWGRENIGGITFMIKPPAKDTFIDHPYRIANFEAVHAEVKQAFPQYPITVATWAGMSLNDQLKIMETTKILVGVSGSNMMNAIFLKKNSGIVYICNGVEQNPGNEWRIWLQKLPWIRDRLICSEGLHGKGTPELVVVPSVLIRYIHELLREPHNDPFMSKF